MLLCIEEYGKYIETTGYHGVKFESAEAFLKANRGSAIGEVEVQFFDAGLIATSEHLYFAAVNALAAFSGKTNLSKSVAVEMMLYAAAQRQIRQSIAKIGINPQTSEVAVALVGKDAGALERMRDAVSLAVGAEPDDSVLELTPQKSAKIREVFGISQNMLDAAQRGTESEALVALVVERVALLSTQL
ncbi:MAG: KEOPS complex subunit Cgi121 [Candidatus Bathyarchaeota archaeon]|nr:KEOPS complex subunit Cgi121 [Candidatus Bathyarchaeota archaeon]